jgi:rfaE bifunctional protein kinase chain/domain
MQDFKKLFESFSSLKVGVIGDVMLDTYMWGNVERISPEAPVPVVSLQKKEYRVGGAANVALNCKSLGAQVAILSIIGNDAEAILLGELLETERLDNTWLIKSPARITTSKTRIISRNQQMLRLDSEITNDLGLKDEAALLQNIQVYIATVDPDIIIFEDYNKGVLTEKLITETIAICKAAGVITAADPKHKNFFAYKHTDIFKPNLKEVRESLRMLIDKPSIGVLKTIHEELENILHHHISFITLSEHGVFYQLNADARVIPSHLRSVADVSGAGDTVIAVAAMVYAATKNVHLMAELANIAGGLVCEEVGTVSINKVKLLHECEILLS